MPVTIKEIALAANVSIASVSRTLNEQAGVGSATRARIEAVVQKMGYTPDSRARALVTGEEMPFLALAVPDIANPFYAELARGAEQALDEHRCSLLLVSTGWQNERLARAFELLSSRRVAQLLIAAPVEGLVMPWERYRHKVVLIGQTAPRGSGLDAVDTDDRHGGWLAGRHLLALGWRRIAFIAGPERDCSAQARLAGLRRALNGDPLVTSFGEWTVQSGYDQASALLRRRRPPDAIFAGNDLLALGVARAAVDNELKLGRDLGLMGYDDIEPLKYLEIPISSIAQSKREMGAKAIRLLLGGGQRGGRGRRVRLKPELVARQSCGECQKEHDA